MPTQVCGPSAGAMCETQEFTTLKSLGKYRRSLRTRSRVSRRWHCCQLSFFSRLSFFLCKLHAHSSICTLVFPFIPIFLRVLMGGGWNITEPLASSLSVISVFLSPSRSQFQNTHSHSDQQQPIAWFIPQWVHSLTLPRLRQPGLYNLQKTSLILIIRKKEKKTLHFRGWNFWAIYSHSVTLKSLTDLGEHALRDKRRRAAGSVFVWTHFCLGVIVSVKDK